MIRFLLAMLVSLLAVAAPAQDALESLRDSAEGFPRVVPGRTFEFPRDHGAHPDYRIEWWYLTANLVDGQGRHWGLQWTLFRQALAPEPAETGWHSNQIWMAHAAVTTPDGHFHEQRFARGGIGQAGVDSPLDEGLFNAWLDDWEWRSDGVAMFPASLRFTVGEHEVVVSLEATGEPVLNGIGGYSQKSAQGQASYYYSQPRIHVQGFIGRGAEREYLAGQGWLDREWSSQALADNQPGWDWFSLHLDDGRKLMVYRLRHDGGAHWLSGSWIEADGGSRHLGQDAIDLVPLQIRRLETGRHGIRELPLEWRISLAQPRLSLRIRPLYDEQWMDASFPYWEGVVLVEDGDGNSAGIGYMELTGYQ